jgi:hypothetical protein
MAASRAGIVIGPRFIITGRPKIDKSTFSRQVILKWGILLKFNPQQIKAKWLWPRFFARPLVWQFCTSSIDRHHSQGRELSHTICAGIEVVARLKTKTQ